MLIPFCIQSASESVYLDCMLLRNNPIVKDYFLMNKKRQVLGIHCFGVMIISSIGESVTTTHRCLSRPCAASPSWTVDFNFMFLYKEE